jgi:hypothetical protein
VFFINENKNFSSHFKNLVNFRSRVRSGSASVSQKFRLKRKESKRKRKIRKRNSEKKVFVSLNFAKKRKKLSDEKMNLI